MLVGGEKKATRIEGVGGYPKSIKEHVRKEAIRRKEVGGYRVCRYNTREYRLLC